MKVFIEIDNDFILLSDTLDESSIQNDGLKEEIINRAMDMLENKKINMEEIRHKLHPVKMLKLGVHPDMERKPKVS